MDNKFSNRYICQFTQLSSAYLQHAHSLRWGGSWTQVETEIEGKKHHEGTSVTHPPQANERQVLFEKLRQNGRIEIGTYNEQLSKKITKIDFKYLKCISL